MKPVYLFGLGAIFAAAASCSSSTSLRERTHFSRTDSLTDIYLVLQDSLLQSWNRVISYERDRKEALSEMVDQLLNSTIIDQDQKKAYDANLDQIDRIRFTQKSMNDRHVIEEYDRACEDLARQLSALSLASAQLQSRLDELETLNFSNAQQRQYYDSIANQYNSFIKMNWSDLKELGNSVQLDQKPLFITVENR